jgi:hypothetical protein
MLLTRLRNHSSPYLGLSAPFNYYVDATNGNDSNSGATPALAFKTLSKISASLTSAGKSTRVLVRAGAYSTATDYVAVAQAALGCYMEIVFEPGCTMDGTLANASPGVATWDAFEFDGTNNYTSRVYGNGLQCANYADSTHATSPNGIGNRNNHILWVHDVYCTNCDDGISAHDSATIYAYDCTFGNGYKSAFAHIITSKTYHYRCTFTGRVGATLGIGAVSDDTATGYFEDCVFVPTANDQFLDVRNSILLRCQIGTLTNNVKITTPAASPTPSLSKCFVNAWLDGNAGSSLSQCFGKLSIRQRSGGSQTAQNCIITAPASSKTSVIYNDAALAAQTLAFNNNIVKTATAAAFMSVDATTAGQMVSAAQKFWNNAMNGSAAYDADLIAADSGGAVIKSTLTANTNIGAGNTLLMADYAYGTGSPAIGAGTGGGNIGFGASDVAVRATRVPALP